MQRRILMLAVLGTLLFMVSGPFISSNKLGAQGPADNSDPQQLVSWSDVRPDGPWPLENTLPSERSLTPMLGVAPLTVFPPDERWQVSPTTFWPASSVAYLEIIKQYTPYGYNELCTGTFIGPKVLLTAAHCLYDSENGWATSVAVAPGRDGASLPYSYALATDWNVTNGWYTYADFNYDWGLILMPSNVGDTVGWLSLASFTTESLARPDFWPLTVGYPGDKPLGTQWAGTKSAFTEVLPNLLRFTIDAYPGQSGSAIWRTSDQYIAGIVSKQTTTYNQGVRITSSVLNSALDWCNTKGCTFSYYVESPSTSTPSPTRTATPTATRTTTPTATSTPTSTATRTPIPTPVNRPGNQINFTNEGVDPPVLMVAEGTPVVWFNYSSWDYTLSSGALQRVFLPLVTKQYSGSPASLESSSTVGLSSHGVSGTFTGASIAPGTSYTQTLGTGGEYPYYLLPRLYNGRVVVEAAAPTPTATSSPTMTPTPTSTETATPSPTAEQTSTPTATATGTATVTPSNTTTATATATSTGTATATPTSTITPTPVSYTVTWTSRAPMSTSRSGLGLAATTAGKLYAIGGENSTYYPTRSTLSSVEMYDPDSNSWTTRASMSTNRAWLAAATASNGKIYAVGGAVDRNYSALATVEEYDPTSNAWAAKTSMPTPRHSLALVPANDKLYAIGGSSPTGASAVVEVYEPATDTWSTLSNVPTRRSNLAAVLGSDGLIYVIGGTGSQPLYDTVEAYDPATDSWATKAGLPTARVGLGAALGPNGRIYAIGGNDGSGMSRAVEEYNPATDIWIARSGMPTARQLVAVVNDSSGVIYAIGGEPTYNQTLATVEEATIQ